MSIPASWFGPSSHNLKLELVNLGLSQMQAISIACAKKYGTSEYFNMHREERQKVRWEAVYSEICQHLNIDFPHKKVLVVGVNDGMDIEIFKHCHIIGIDPCHQALSIAKTKFPDHEFQISIAENLPLEDNTIDTYIALRVVNCSTVNIKSLAAELQRVLKPKAPFLFSIANGFFDGETYCAGTFKDGEIDFNYAETRARELLDILEPISTQLTSIKYPIENFIFGYKA
jgi:ubiquinone/menaquinone biosynthesis C-methylase UbiE